MTSRRLDIILPIVTLVVSFVGVLTLGQMFAVGQPDPTPPQVQASAQITVRDLSIEIVLHDPSTEDPAPGILQVDPPVGVSGRRLCLTEAVSESWTLIGENGLPGNDADAVCRNATANQPNGELMIMLVKR